MAPDSIFKNYNVYVCVCVCVLLCVCVCARSVGLLVTINTVVVVERTIWEGGGVKIGCLFFTG